MGNSNSSAHRCGYATADVVCVHLGAPKSVWGPLMWRHLHLRAIAWRGGQDVRSVVSEYAYLRRTFENLMCVACRVHSLRYYDAHMPDLSTSEAYQAWMYAFHNAVNRRLGKRVFTPADYRRAYGGAY